MRVELKYCPDMWYEIKDNALFTVKKEKGKYPDEIWKKKILLSEHSPIRSGRIILNVYDVPSFVIGHLVRHTQGVTPFVASLRSDRTEYKDGKVPDRNTLNNIRLDMNFQAFINISRKRLCHCASKETREVWYEILKAIKIRYPQLFWVCVPECVYRGGCPEMFPCEDCCWGNFVKWAKEGGKDVSLLSPLKRYNLYSQYRIEKENI